MNAKHLIGALIASSMLVSLSASLAQAAPPSVQFGITIGEPPPPPPPPPPGPKPHWPPPPSYDDCMSIKEIFSDLGDQGFYKFRNYNDADDDFFFVDARRGSKLYRLRVDSCDGEILGMKRLKSPF